MWNESPVPIAAEGCMTNGVVEVAAGCGSFPRPAPPPRAETPHDAVEAWTSSARGFLASIREAIETLSSGEDYPTVRATAEFVGMSVRTLQRRLAQAGVSHQLLVAQARFATAAVVLERPDAKILEVALDLGYSDHANFTRAFRRWAGCAPREYRSSNTRPLQSLSAQGFAGGGIAPVDRRAREEEVP